MPAVCTVFVKHYVLVIQHARCAMLGMTADAYGLMCCKHMVPSHGIIPDSIGILVRSLLLGIALGRLLHSSCGAGGGGC